MFLSTETLRQHMAAFDKAQDYPIELFVVAHDVVSIAMTTGNILIGGVGIASLQAGDVLYGGGSVINVVSVGVGAATINPPATATGLFQFAVLRKVTQEGGGNPRVHELAPKGLAMLGQMTDRIFTRAWLARIVKGALPGNFTGEKRYALKLPGRGFLICSLIDNVASEAQNPELAHTFYLVAG